MLAFWSRSSSYRRAPEAPARCEEAFFVAPWPSRVAVRCAAAGLPPAGATGRCARSQDPAKVHRPAQAQRAAERTEWRGGGCSPRPAPQAKVVNYHHAMGSRRGLDALGLIFCRAEWTALSWPAATSLDERHSGHLGRLTLTVGR